MENPFKYGGIVRGPHFADRTEELSELVREMTNLNRVFLLSPRRFGKTCLLFNLMDKLRDLGFASAYLDLNAYPNLPGFAVAFTHITSKTLESSTEKLMKLFAGLKRLRPRVSVGPEGSITASVEMAADHQEAIPALLEGMRQADQLARQKDKKLVVAIDEFSDLPKYDGETLEKAMRSEIQQHTHTGYIFSGSEQSIMLAMSRDRKRAFYKLGRLMELGAIDRDAYADFIHGWLGRGGYTIQKQELDRIFELARDIPYNIQRICHTMWESAREAPTRKLTMVEELPFVIAQQDSPHFELIWQTASQQQRILLIALSQEPNAKPFSKDFQLKHAIGPSSSIKASLDSLVKKGILFRFPEGTYQFSDTFMQYWIKHLRSSEH